jgi:tRNA pseudouridine38-40 synthase
MPRCALLIEYDGTEYAGWQRQQNATTVQEVLENAVAKIMGTDSASVIGSGRTDSGVHAFGQVAHTDIPNSSSIPDHQLPKAFNAVLPRDVRVRAAKIVDASFHARFQAKRREYRYTVCRQYSVFRRLYSWHVKHAFSTDTMRSAAEIFCGQHDFTTFSKHNPSTENYVCHVQEAQWSEVEAGVWHFHIAADRFVYGMVRCIVGAMMDAALRKRSIDDLQEALERKDRLLSSPLAPPEGLILWRVSYDNDPFDGIS